MIKFGALALSAMLLVGGAAGLVKQPAQEEVYYRDSYDITYDESGSSNAIIEDLSVTYSTRTRDTYAQALRFPNYDYAPAASACAAIAGANLIGFFDRYDENLIPNHSSGTAVGTTYIYSSEDSAVQAVIRELYSYMGTTATGTTEKKFKDGLTNFCKDKGHNISFTSCMQGESFSYSLAQNYLKQNQPIALFLSGYNVTTMTENSNNDSLSVYVSDAPHIMIGFGYKTYVYDGNRVYNYISVASGLNLVSSGLFNINYKTKINNALAVNIT